jgi:hypothetical protein
VQIYAHSPEANYLAALRRKLAPLLTCSIACGARWYPTGHGQASASTQTASALSGFAIHEAALCTVSLFRRSGVRRCASRKSERKRIARLP